MRFFATFNDEAIMRYLNSIKKEDEIFLTMDSHSLGDIQVTGFLHVASLGEDAYEIGVTVDHDVRQLGVGSSLFDRAFTFLKAKGCKKIYINCLSTNVPMQRIVAKHKLTIVPDDDPSTRTAVLEMDNKPDFYAWLKGAQQDQIALFDLALKQIPHF